MPPLKALDPAPRRPLTDLWALVGMELGRTQDGPRGTIHLWNGRVVAFDTFTFSDHPRLDAFVQRIATEVGISPDVGREAVLDLAVAMEVALRESERAGKEQKASQATRMVELALDAGLQLFHTPGADAEAYATLQVQEHEETWRLKTRGVRRWLARLYYEAEEKSPGAQAVQDALGVLEGKALFDGPTHPVYVRLAPDADAIILDLGNDAWQVVRITGAGWEVLKTSPVKFWRPRGLLPLPLPVPGGTLAALRPLCNIGSDENWYLLVAWLLAALRPVGPYPILLIHGEQGSAKSSLVRLLRLLIDPNEAALRPTPRDERDLVIAATHGQVIALDNVSHLADWLSDALCRVATGAGFGTRELYTDDEEKLFAFQRPVVINGIEELAVRGDLLDRAILLYLPAIDPDLRKTERAFWSEVETVHARLLGVLCTVLGQTLAALPSVVLDQPPRMADFAHWACAAASACGWTSEDFLLAYTTMVEGANTLVLEASSIAPFLATVVALGPRTCTAAELHKQLGELAGEAETKKSGWPKNPRALSNALRRLAPNLRRTGIVVSFERQPGGNRERLITLQRQQTDREEERF